MLCSVISAGVWFLQHHDFVVVVVVDDDDDDVICTLSASALSVTPSQISM